MSVLENFKNIPRSPYGGRQGSNVIFFLQICNEVPGGKKEGACRPLTGDRPPVAHPSGDQRLQTPGGRSPIPRATGSGDLYIRPPPSFPPHLTSKNPQKIQKKERGEEKGSGEALPNSALVIYR